ncbi:MAG: phosphomannomutase, partial [Candidatus Eisenbacteria bacterium]|nr:phosphomannomutase [Candidatus Eisenbacteria bacterium]
IDTLPSYFATPEIRIDCSDDKKFDVVAAVLRKYQETHEVSDVDGARIDYADGWGLVRASNTQPVLVLRAEGETEAARDRIETELREGLRALGVTA